MIITWCLVVVAFQLQVIHDLKVCKNLILQGKESLLLVFVGTRVLICLCFGLPVGLEVCFAQIHLSNTGEIILRALVVEILRDVGH